MEKAIVCACEDVSVHDIEETIARGFTDIESIKRYTGLGTGPCQGKSCTVAAVRISASRRSLNVSTVDTVGAGAASANDDQVAIATDPQTASTAISNDGSLLVPGATSLQRPPKADAPVPFRARPPHAPTSLAAYAGLPLESLPLPAAAALPTNSAAQIAKVDAAREPLPERAEVVIIGGGIMGLALAWHLAGKGMKPLVLERGYLCAGASGRNGGGVRAQWTTPTLIELAKESIEFMGRFAQELGINIWLRKGGYLFLAHDEATGRRLEESTELQRRHGLPTRMIGPAEACEIAPQLDRSRFISAAWNPDDGVVFPWPFLWGYADGARKRGARIETFTQVTGIDLDHASSGRDGSPGEMHVRAVRTDRGTVQADRVVIASGAWSPNIAGFANIKLPNRPYRHEIVSSEPLKPFLGPLVSMLGTGLYFSQSMRGEIVGGMGDPDEPAGLNQTSSLRFLRRYSRALTELMPQTGAVKLLRQWAGCYDVTPDHSPILGHTKGASGLLQMSGFVGHGFMMAPAVARRMADWMCGAEDEIFERYALQRFAEGRSEKETFIIG